MAALECAANARMSERCLSRPSHVGPTGLVDLTLSVWSSPALYILLDTVSSPHESAPQVMADTVVQIGNEVPGDRAVLDIDGWPVFNRRLSAMCPVLSNRSKELANPIPS